MRKMNNDFYEEYIGNFQQTISIACSYEEIPDYDNLNSVENKVSAFLKERDGKKVVLARMLEKKHIPVGAYLMTCEMDDPRYSDEEFEELKKNLFLLICIGPGDCWGMDFEEAKDWIERQEESDPVFNGRHIMPLVLKKQDMNRYISQTRFNESDYEYEPYMDDYYDMDLDPDNETEFAMYSILEDEHQELLQALDDARKDKMKEVHRTEEKIGKVKEEYTELISDNTAYTHEMILECVKKDKEKNSYSLLSFLPSLPLGGYKRKSFEIEE